MRKFSLAAMLSSILISPAFAQQRSGTPEEQKACTRDVERFCRKIMDQGDFVVLACLQQNRAKLTAACAQVLTNHGQ
jgi:cysteine rich repeat protein